jgi:DnaJ-domain-containing protein 1
MSNGKLTAILLNLHKSRRSGILRVENKTEKKQLALDEGRLAFAESSLPGEHIARIMTEQKLLAGAKLREVALAMKKGKTGEEAILEISGVKTQDVANGLAAQATAILASLWKWNDFDMHFYAGENLISRKIKAGLSLPDVIISSARHAVAKHLFIAPHEFFEGRLEAAGALITGVGEIPFNESETSVLMNLKKPLNTMDLMAKAAMRSGNPEEAILSLKANGLISFQSLDEVIMNAPDQDAMIMILENELRRVDTANHYEVLSVSRNVSPDNLREAYHRMARQLHPDRFQSKDFSEEIMLKAQKAFAAINEAYFVLKDPAARKAYDEHLSGIYAD